MKNWLRWRNLKWATASQSHRMCVADSSSFRHLSQMGSLISPNLKRCPFRWQCPVSSPTTHLNWSLFSLNRSFVLLAEGLCISPFACLSPVKDSQYSLCFLLVQSLTAFLATPTEMPQTGSGPMNGCGLWLTICVLFVGDGVKHRSQQIYNGRYWVTASKNKHVCTTTIGNSNRGTVFSVQSVPTYTQNN
jgi:hypothetical protein